MCILMTRLRTKKMQRMSAAFFASFKRCMKLLTKTKSLDQLSVTIDVLILQISKQVSSLTYHLQKTSSGMEIMRMALEVLVQVIDSCCKNSNLYFR